MSDTQQQWIKTLEAIYREAVDAIITIDAHGKVTSINPATETLFGYSSDELLGQNVHVLMPQPHRNKHDSYIKNFQATGEKKIIGEKLSVGAKTGVPFPSIWPSAKSVMVRRKCSLE
jgi:PAS domain S-box-containing protein